jgi:hypothetical protein
MTNGIFRGGKLAEKINDLESYSKSKNIRDISKSKKELRKVTNLELI